jgi:hypothetical protein
MSILRAAASAVSSSDADRITTRTNTIGSTTTTTIPSTAATTTAEAASAVIRTIIRISGAHFQGQHASILHSYMRRFMIGSLTQTSRRGTHASL